MMFGALKNPYTPFNSKAMRITKQKSLPFPNGEDRQVPKYCVIATF
jgi:hypothetical protein